VVDEWWQREHPPLASIPGRPPLLSDAEVLTLAILSQWPRWRSERDFCRFADAHLREYFPNLLSPSQLNRRIRALEPEMRAAERPSGDTHRTAGGLPRARHYPYPRDRTRAGLP